MTRKTIAIVEDNEDNMLLFEAMLEDLYDTRPYTNGAEALDEIPQQPPDLVLLDISLPGIDGVEVLKTLRGIAELSQVPIVALTAHAMIGDRERLLAEGFDDYIAKPITDESAFFAQIARLI